MKNIAIALLLLLPNAARADDIRFAPDVVVAAAVTLVADANGVLQIDRSKPILIGSITSTSPTDPTDPTDPIPPVTDPLASKVAALITSAPNATTDKNTRTALASLYEMTGKLPLTDPSQIRQATSLLFDAMNLPAAWENWKADADSFAASLTAADTKRSWQLISEGLAK